MTENPYRYSLTTRLKEKDVIAFLDIKKDSVLLDIGCGLGFFLNKISSNKLVKMVGIDPDYQSVKFCKMHLSNPFVSADAQNLPFKSDIFDRIMYSDVIEHVADDKASLGEIKRVSNNNAVVVITTEAREGLFTGTKLNMLGHDVRGTLEYHMRDGYYLKELEDLLREQNFELMDYTFSTVLLGELIIELTKWIYFKKKKQFSSQFDLITSSRSILFKIYQYIFFPVFLVIGRIENFFLRKFLKGHVLIVKARVLK